MDYVLVADIFEAVLKLGNVLWCKLGGPAHFGSPSASHEALEGCEWVLRENTVTLVGCQSGQRTGNTRLQILRMSGGLMHAYYSEFHQHQAMGRSRRGIACSTADCIHDVQVGQSPQTFIDPLLNERLPALPLQVE